MRYRIRLLLCVAVLIVSGGCFGLDAELGVGPGPFKIIKLEAE